MNSEKVKEIKQGLECCTNPVYCEKECPYHIYERHLECINELAKDSLILINELESENDRLVEERGLYKKQFNELEPRFFDLREENKQLKQDLKKSIDMQKEMLDGFKLSTKEVEENLAREIPNLLKQFAERLKAKIRVIVDFYKDHPDKCFNGISEKGIDETLEEFLK